VNWKGFGRKPLWPNLLWGTEKNKENSVRIDGVWAGDVSGQLPNIGLQRYPWSIPFGGLVLDLSHLFVCFSVCAAGLGPMCRTAVATPPFITRRSMDTSKCSDLTCISAERPITCLMVVFCRLKVVSVLFRCGWCPPSNRSVHYYYYYYYNCKLVFTRWQWYCNKTQNTPHSNKTQHTKPHQQ
jgi:hypothetical protein